MFERLRQVAIFKGFADADLARLAAELDERYLEAGEVLFRQGDEGNNCYVILTGELAVITYINGAELRLGTRYAGEIIGEMALIDSSPRSATVRAVTAGRLAALNKQHFTTLMSNDPVLALELLRDGTAHLRSTSRRMIADLEQKNAELSRAYQELQAAQAEVIRLTRLEEELAVARRIQELFLPRTLPQFSGWEIAAFSRGAQAVGGDFFDCIELPNGHLGLVVADVCGKGVPAALFVALTRSLLRAASQAPWAFQGDRITDPDLILTGALWLVNDYLTREHGDSDMFTTLFYGVLDPRTGQLSYTNAGHNPPLIVGMDGSAIRELEAANLPLGVMSHQTYATAQTTLVAGETFVGFSDGITEAMNMADEPYGDERLLAMLHAHAGASATRLLETIVQAVETYVAGAPQADDMTLLIVSRAMLPA
jgi:phosphoserine phosphatase RsbU/P